MWIDGISINIKLIKSKLPSNSTLKVIKKDMNDLSYHIHNLMNLDDSHYITTQYNKYSNENSLCGPG